MSADVFSALLWMRSMRCYWKVAVVAPWQLCDSGELEPSGGDNGKVVLAVRRKTCILFSSTFNFHVTLEPVTANYRNHAALAHNASSYLDGRDS